MLAVEGWTWVCRVWECVLVVRGRGASSQARRAYLEVEKRMKGDVSEKACTAAVLVSSVVANVNRIIDVLLL